MKKLYSLTSRTKAEHNSNSAPATVATTSYPTFGAAHAAFKSAVALGTASYFELYGPSGLVFKRTNPAGG
jgi:hypothetical protein